MVLQPICVNLVINGTAEESVAHQSTGNDANWFLQMQIFGILLACYVELYLETQRLYLLHSHVLLCGVVPWNTTAILATLPCIAMSSCTLKHNGCTCYTPMYCYVKLYLETQRLYLLHSHVLLCGVVPWNTTAVLATLPCIAMSSCTLKHNGCTCYTPMYCYGKLYLETQRLYLLHSHVLLSHFSASSNVACYTNQGRGLGRGRSPRAFNVHTIKSIRQARQYFLCTSGGLRVAFYPPISSLGALTTQTVRCWWCVHSRLDLKLSSASLHIVSHCPGFVYCMCIEKHKKDVVIKL